MAFSVNNHDTPNNHTISGITYIVQAQEGPNIKYLNLIKSQHEAPGSRVEAAGPDSGLASVTARHSSLPHHTRVQCPVTDHDLHHTAGDLAGGDHLGPGAPALPGSQHPLLQPHRGHGVHGPGGGHSLPGLRGEQLSAMRIVTK